MDTEQDQRIRRIESKVNITLGLAALGVGFYGADRLTDTLWKTYGWDHDWSFVITAAIMFAIFVWFMDKTERH